MNIVDRSLNFGVTYTGLLDQRPNDRMGLGINVAGAGDPYRKDLVSQEAPVTRYETDIDLTYHAKINEWLKVQPDIQYIIHPNLDPSLRDDLIVGLHFEIGHWFEL